MRGMNSNAANPASTTSPNGNAQSAEGAPSPTVLVATTAQVYVLPFVREPTVMGAATSVFDCVVPPSLEVQVTV